MRIGASNTSAVLLLQWLWKGSRMSRARTIAADLSQKDIYIHESPSSFAVRHPSGKTLCTIAKPYRWDFGDESREYHQRLGKQRDIAEWIADSLRANKKAINL